MDLPYAQAVGSSCHIVLVVGGKCLHWPAPLDLASQYRVPLSNTGYANAPTPPDTAYIHNFLVLDTGSNSGRDSDRKSLMPTLFFTKNSSMYAVGDQA
jgi:hypothetical protein